METVTPAFTAALAASHTLAVRVEVTWPDSSTDDLPFTGGEVTVDASSKVRRTLSLEVPDMAAWREIVLGGATLRPYRGIRFIDNTTELVPLGVFEVRGTSEDLSGLSPGKLTVPDRWRRVQRARLYVPLASDTGLTIPQQWGELVTDAVPGSSFVDGTSETRSTPHAVWERDRDAAAEDLAASIGAEGFFDTLGDARLRPVPTLGSPVWTVAAGPTGVLLGGSEERTEDEAYSAVVVHDSRTDGSTPFTTVVVEDLEVLSPTYALGPFGKVPRFYSSPLITTSGQATTAAEALLAKVTGFASSVGISAIVHPGLDVGDTIEVGLLDGRRQLHVVDALTIPLTEAESMPIKTRSRTIVEAE